MCLSLAGGQGWRTTVEDIPLTQDVVTGYPDPGLERFYRRVSVVKVVAVKRFSGIRTTTRFKV